MPAQARVGSMGEGFKYARIPREVGLLCSCPTFLSDWNSVCFPPAQRLLSLQNGANKMGLTWPLLPGTGSGQVYIRCLLPLFPLGRQMQGRIWIYLLTHGYLHN